MTKIALPDIHTLGITRDGVLREATLGPAGGDRKLHLADAAQRIMARTLSRIVQDEIATRYETHEAIYGECPVAGIGPAQWDGEAQAWVAALRDELARAFTDWTGRGGSMADAMQAAEVWREDDRIMRAQWIAGTLAQEARIDGDGKFLAACGVTAADYAASVETPEAAPAPPAPPPPPPAPRAPAIPPTSAYAAPPPPPRPAPEHAAPPLPGATVGQPTPADLAAAFKLLAEGLDYEGAALAVVAGASASGLRNWMSKGGTPRKFSAHQGAALRVEIDRRMDALRRAADIFGAVRD